MRYVCHACVSLLEGEQEEYSYAVVGPHDCAVCGLSCDQRAKPPALRLMCIDNKRAEEIHYLLAKKLATETMAEARGAAVAKCGP